jgi:hypothetical protein|tara:strand:+ start:1082 stop:1240 length:159 start_codon:yes stop_codon:yes gene_type:complete
MDINLILLISLLVFGVSFTSWKLGIKEGIKRTVDFIDENKLIDFDEYEKNDT